MDGGFPFFPPFFLPFDRGWVRFLETTLPILAQADFMPRQFGTASGGNDGNLRIGKSYAICLLLQSVILVTDRHLLIYWKLTFVASKSPEWSPQLVKYCPVQEFLSDRTGIGSPLSAPTYQ